MVLKTKAMNYNKYLDKYIKENPIPKMLLYKIKTYFFIERNIYSNYDIKIGQMDGNVELYLN